MVETVTNSKVESVGQSDTDVHVTDEIYIDYQLVQIEIRYAQWFRFIISLVTLIIELVLLMIGRSNIAFLMVSSDVFVNSFCLCLLYDKDTASNVYQ